MVVHNFLLQHASGTVPEERMTLRVGKGEVMPQACVVRQRQPEAKNIDLFICKARKKLSDAMVGENPIETVWGRGYVLRDPSPARRSLSALEIQTPRKGRLSPRGGRDFILAASTVVLG